MPNLDKYFEKIVVVLGSTPVIIASFVWCIHQVYSNGYDFLDVVSMITFLFGEFILRGQSSQVQRIEKNIEQTKKDTKIDLQKSDKTIDLLKKQK